MQHNQPAPQRARRGQATIIIAIASIPILLMVGMTVDAGNLLMQRRIAQSAADAATIAGTRAAGQSGATATSVQNEVNSYISGNTGPFGTTTLASIAWVDSAGAIIGSAGSTLGTMPSGAKGVQVTTSRQFSTYFLQLIGQSQFDVQGQATATYTASGGGGAVGAIYALNTSSTGITMNGGNNITASAVVVNNRITMNGTNTITGPTYVAQSSITENTDANNCIRLAASPCVSGTDPGLYLNQSTVSDPLASIPAPTQPANSTTDTSSGRSCNGSSPANDKTLQPGRYTGAITANGGCRLYFTSGLYWLEGGLTLNGGSHAMAQGGTAETLLYFNNGSLTLNGSTTLQLNPQSSGSQQGILVFFKRGMSSSITLNGHNSMYGTIYANKGTVTYNGNNAGNYQGQIIADRFTMNGTSTINPLTTGPKAVAVTTTVGGGGGSTITVELVQ